MKKLLTWGVLMSLALNTFAQIENSKVLNVFLIGTERVIQVKFFEDTVYYYLDLKTSRNIELTNKSIIENLDTSIRSTFKIYRLCDSINLNNFYSKIRIDSNRLICNDCMYNYSKSKINNKLNYYTIVFSDSGNTVILANSFVSDYSKSEQLRLNKTKNNIRIIEFEDYWVILHLYINESTDERDNLRLGEYIINFISLRNKERFKREFKLCN